MSVCYECPTRHEGCGATCDKFKAERAERQKVYEQRALQVEIGNVLDIGYQRMKKQGARWTRKWKTERGKKT